MTHSAETVACAARRLFLRTGLAVGAIGLLLTGCGPAGPVKHLVTGTVTLDGQPIPDGNIILSDPQLHLSPAGGKIVDGQYRLESWAGTKCVAVFAHRDTGEEFNEMMQMTITKREQYVPARYNDRSELTIEVAAGDNQINLELTSQ